MRIKAVFFGAGSRSQYRDAAWAGPTIRARGPGRCPGPPCAQTRQSPADLDDTLVLTTKGDVLALEEVGGVARQLCPEVDSERLLVDWRQLFMAEPWDVTHQASDFGWDWR